jgi:outer membrane protein
MRRYICALFVFLLLAGQDVISQTPKDSVLREASLQDCIQYALKHQPLVQQSLIDEEITERQIKSRLADWYPQLNFNYSYQHNFQLQAAFFNGNVAQNGARNVSTVGASLTQNIFNRDALLASRSAGDVRKQFKQTTAANKIDVVVNVSKAFYDVLLTARQIDLLNEDIIRLERSLKDAYSQYQGGIVDKTDYKRATIALNNAKAQRKNLQELLTARYATLKQEMGYVNNNQVTLLYDSAKIESEIFIDTTAAVKYDDRIEYQLLQTQKRLLEANVKYNKWAYVPTISAFGAYNVGGFFNNEFSKLYSRNYSNSFAGLQLTFPIFQGGKRVQNIKEAELQLHRIDWSIVSVTTAINTEYTTAFASYKSNLNDYIVLKENLELARDVYNTIQLQYKAGIKTYLDVIIAETDLRSAQVNYTNALYQLISSKLDVQRALGTVQY